MNKKSFLSILLVLTILLSSLQMGFALDLDNLTQYDMNITLDTKNQTIEGDQKLTFTNTYNTELNDLVFHLYLDSYKSYETLPAVGGMYFMNEDDKTKMPEDEKGYIEIKKVYINDKEAKYTDKNQILKINMGQPLKKGETVEVKIEFTVKIPAGYHRMHYKEGVYSLTNWYPVLSIYNENDKKWDENPYHIVGESNYSDVSDYNVNLTVPKKMVVSPTGKITQEKEEGESKTVTIKAEKVREFVILMSDKYKVKTKEVDGIKISNYYLDDGKKDNASADMILDEVAKTVKFMNKTIGKYPYDELRIAEAYLNGGAMEYPQVIQMGRYHDLSDENIDERAPFIIEAAVHETVHQWWYVGVGNNEFKEPFLDESLTVFTTAYYFEQEYGKDHENGINFKIRNSIYPSNIMPLNSSVNEFKDWGDYGEAIYSRGPAFFEDLKQRVGEEKFVKILKTYYEKYKYKNATIKGLLDVIGEVAGASMQTSMKEMLTKPNYFPENISLSTEEQRDYYRNQRKRELKQMEDAEGLIIGSIILRGLEGEDIIIVKPEYLNEKDSLAVDEFTKILKRESDENGFKIDVKKEEDITEEDKKSNLILIGYPKRNSIIKEMSPDLPINIDEDIINIDGVSIKNKDITGTFIGKNPKSKDKLALIIFLDENISVENSSGRDVEVVEVVVGENGEKEEYTIYNNDIYNYNPIYNYEHQFIINTKDIVIQGKYNSGN